MRNTIFHSLKSPSNQTLQAKDTHSSGEKNMLEFSQFVTNWKTAFVERIKEETKSKKQNFGYQDALKRSEFSRNDFDKTMIEYLCFINSDPLQNNDYFKYVNSYKKGKKLNEKYFRHNVKKLHEYYTKSDKDPQYNPFSPQQYNKYVLFMMLKFSGKYLSEFDKMFGVKSNKSREYNPLTSIPSVLRGVLPFKIKEYDISRAYPTFIFMELGMIPFDVYNRIDKCSFNTLLNIHNGVKGATIEVVRSKLEPIYKNRVNEVITDERFNNKGQMFEDLAKYEAEYIEKFVNTNNPKLYVRLHDGVVVLHETECEILKFGQVTFKTKDFVKPEFLKEVVTFYDIDREGKTITSPVTYSRFFEQENFIRITREGHDQLTILKNDNRIVSPINHKTDLVPFLKININEFDTSPLEDRIARDSTSTIQQSLQLLTPIPLEYHRDSKEHCDIPFKNGIARITASDMELIPYDKINGFFAKHNTQKHEISFTSENNSEFYRFLKMAVTDKDIAKSSPVGDDWKNISAFCTMFGYLISNYKNPSSNFAIILSDANADGETRNGGRGKSLLQTALTHFRPSIVKSGNEYDPTYRHVHADLKREHDLYVIDDVPSNFDYNTLYTKITGPINPERKGITGEIIPFTYTPKFVISTNWAVRYDSTATSTNRRFREYKFSSFWNINNTPEKYFGKSFFTDWDREEWNAFYNFGFFCVQQFLKHGIQTIDYDKKADNFRAYFFNDAILEETERIFDLLNNQEIFSVTDFVRIHLSSDLFRYKPLFTPKNAKKYIENFIEYKKLPYLFKTHDRKWEKIHGVA